MKNKNLSADELLSAVETKSEKRNSFFKFIGVSAVVLAAVALIVLFFTDITAPRNNKTSVEQLENQGSGRGYPYFMRAGDIIDSGVSNGNLVFAVPGKVTVLNGNAKELSSLQHNCKKPSLEISDNHILLYDREGTYVRMQDSRQILWEKNLESSILKAKLGKSGDMVFVLRSEKYVNEIHVYDKNFKELFTYHSSSDYIMDTALSDNGKYLAVTSLNAENAQIKSKIQVFDLSRKNPLAEYSYPDVTLFNVSFEGDRNVVAVGNEKRVVLKDFENDKDVEDYGVNELKFFADSENGVQVLSFSEYGSNKNKMKVYKGERELFAYECTGEVRGVSCDGKYVNVLLDSHAVTLNLRGKEVGSFATESDSIDCFTDGKTTYVISMGAVERYNNHSFDK